ncbi:FUSC family protein [Pengzhenrongella sicca]|uniref:FUSC family protein n=1 Tax=Pengzhenrongella sicca TaxID=2819238 RepID=A0A8A4ZBE4_9MICO|nr:FUSC family protein [Pengzhenrongella sicca]QTE29214.1 FUSC family protein [Pengzhenrongella sicca]
MTAAAHDGAGQDHRSAPGRAGLVLRARARQGWARVRGSLVPVLGASAAAGLSFAIAKYGLGHEFPFFAPVSAWVALGFSADRPVRRVAELSIGVAVGVAFGDLLVHLIGSGWWQISVVLAVSALVGRFIDRGALLTTQAGVQAIVIVGLPTIQATGGPIGRWTDALVGGGVALLVATLGSTDPRRRPRQQARNAMHELSGMLRTLARGLRQDDPAGAEESLVRGRAAEPAFEDWRAGAKSSREIARVSPGWVRYSDELTALQDAAAKADHAMRNARVLARRAIGILGADRDLTGLAAAVGDLADACIEIAVAFGTDRPLDRARSDLLAIADRMDPFTLAPRDWQAQSQVLLLRSLVVDLLEVAGVEPQVARDRLPPL